MTVLSDLFTINFNPLRVVISLALALVIGLYIFFIYKKSFSGVMYSRNFNVSLILITLVTTLVLMLISTNITLALGMVGALSIVRFRTAIKDPIDTAFIFWAVGEGLALGVGFFDAAIIGGVVIGIFVLLLSAFKVRSAMPYLLVLHYSEAANGPIKQMIKQLPGARIRRITRPASWKNSSGWRGSMTPASSPTRGIWCPDLDHAFASPPGRAIVRLCGFCFCVRHPCLAYAFALYPLL